MVAPRPIAFRPLAHPHPVPAGTRLVLAHRGASALAPENTLAAFRAAADAGARWIELDVDVLGDGTLIVIHDSLLERTTNRTGPYYDLTAADLPALDAGSWFTPERPPAGDPGPEGAAPGGTSADGAPGAALALTIPAPAPGAAPAPSAAPAPNFDTTPFAGEGVPTLPAVLDLAAQRHLNVNIELKSCQAGATACSLLVDGVAELIDEQARRAPDCEVLVSSFNPLLLERMGRRRPGTPLAILTRVGLLGDDWRSYAEMLGVQAINPANTGLERSRVEEIRALGYGVNVWTVNNRARAEELFTWGATGIFTDRIHEFGDLACP